jgi:hypothetical protein
MDPADEENIGIENKLSKGKEVDKAGNTEEGEDQTAEGGGKEPIEEEDQTDEEEETVGWATMEVHPMDTVCNQAILTICKIDMIAPPAPIVFGTWNDRALNEKQAKLLATEITNTMFRPFATANLLPLILRRDAIEASCISLNPNAEAALMLELTEDAIASGTQLLFAGGRHRQRATQILQGKSRDMIQKLKDDVSDLKKLEKGDGEEGKRREGYQEKLRGLERMLAEEMALEKRIGVWGVVVYDAGECGILHGVRHTSCQVERVRLGVGGHLFVFHCEAGGIQLVAKSNAFDFAKDLFQVKSNVFDLAIRWTCLTWVQVECVRLHPSMITLNCLY